METDASLMADLVDALGHCSQGKQASSTKWILTRDMRNRLAHGYFTVNLHVV